MRDPNANINQLRALMSLYGSEPNYATGAVGQPTYIDRRGLWAQDMLSRLGGAQDERPDFFAQDQMPNYSPPAYQQPQTFGGGPPRNAMRMFDPVRRPAQNYLLNLLGR